MSDCAPSSSVVLTIGHSNHPIERFLDLLKTHSVEVLLDVRSYPYSNYSPQFDREKLKQTLAESGFKYLDLGRELGGRPEGAEFYDATGHVLYDRLAASPIFLEGLSRLQKGIEKYTVAILCSEENPAVCHRALLVGKVLGTRGYKVAHIRGDGTIQPDAEVFASSNPAAAQSELFADAKASRWRSINARVRQTFS